MSASPLEDYQRFNPRLAWAGRLLDALYPVLALLVNRWEEEPPVTLALARPRKILLLESHLIGDTVLASSLLRALRARYPEAELHLLGNDWAEALLGGLGLVDRFVIQRIPWARYDYSRANLARLWEGLLALRRERYDLAIDPRGDARNAVLLWLTRARVRLAPGCTGGRRFLTDVAPSPAPMAPLLEAKAAVLAPLGISGPPPLPSLVATPEAQATAGQVMASLRARHPGPWVGFHPGASQAQRRLSPGKQLALLQALAAAGHPVLLLGTAAERPVLEALAAAAPGEAQVFTANLPEAMAVLGQLGALIGMDSGPAHIAAALGTPLVVIVEPHKVGITTPRGLAPVAEVAPVAGAPVETVVIPELLGRLAAVLRRGA